jgi:hypothetical protein
MFTRSVPDFVLKGRCADLMRLDSEMGSTSRRRGPSDTASFAGERPLVSFHLQIGLSAEGRQMLDDTAALHRRSARSRARP